MCDVESAGFERWAYQFGVAAGFRFGAGAGSFGAVEAGADLGERPSAVPAFHFEQPPFEPLPFGADQPAGFRHRNVLFGRSDLRRDNQCRRILREICSDIVSERRASPAAAVIAAGAATLQKPLGITEPGDIVSHGQCSAMVFCGISK